MRKIDIKELRCIQLSILDDVHEFCQEKGLRYSLCGGTLLGAVRHKGYIPWDDDIDIFMPREDYEIFVHKYVSDENYVLDLIKVPFNRELCIKVCRKGTSMIDKELGRNMWGVNIDIFPIDGCPDDSFSFCGEIARMREQLSIVCPYYKVVKKSLRFCYFIKYCLKRLRHLTFPGALSLKERICKLASAEPLEKSKKGGCIFGCYGEREIMSADIFLEFTTLEFEGKEYSAIKGYDKYLHSLYGDYMQLPPIEKRVTHHLYDAFITE